jgi:4-amino-4-deoxy-L-arabinose transferase-like glycosyltransferase
LYSAVSFFINKTRGLVAGLIMLCTPFFMVMGDSQYADNTVGYFYLATIVLLTFARYTSPEIKPKLLIAAGVTAGLSAWSKNEGLLFITCLFISQLTGVFFKNYKELAKEIKYLLFGVIPILVLIMYFKTAIAPPNDIVKAQGESTLIKLTDLSRYTAIGGWFAKTLGTFGKWFMNPWWLFLVGIIYKGVDLKNNKQSIVSNFVLICLMTIGFFFVYVITPLELEFHLSTSIHRLFFQLFPSFIFLYFIAVKTRENG